MQVSSTKNSPGALPGRLRARRATGDEITGAPEDAAGGQAQARARTAEVRVFLDRPDARIV
jgi:hypothetical protein